MAHHKLLYFLGLIGAMALALTPIQDSYAKHKRRAGSSHASKTAHKKSHRSRGSRRGKGPRQRRNRKQRVVILRNEDFRNGTYRITEPGVYRLSENISFNPHPAGSLNDRGETLDSYRAGRPFRSQYGFGKRDKYDPKGYGIGFFAAIAVESDDVTIDLNGFRLEQSAEHALHQRFFAVIELANKPFIPKQGPSDFGSDFIAAKRVTVKNGTIGRSAHHGIHGNGNVDVHVHNVSFRDYEVAALALNGVQKLRVRNCDAKNRLDVPVVGAYSNARFIALYIDWLVFRNSKTTLKVMGQALDVHEIQEELRRGINAVYEDVIVQGKSIDPLRHPEAFALYHNEHGVIDGNAYGFLVNPLGVAVLGFPFDVETPAQDILFENVDILEQRANVSEVIGLSSEGGIVTDPIGALFMIHNANPRTGDPLTISRFDDPDARYVGNALSNAQALVAKAAKNGEFPPFLDVSRNSIDDRIIRWIESEQPLSAIAKGPEDYYCNGDTMFHVNKGVIGFKIDGAKWVTLRNVSVSNLENLGTPGSQLCGDYEYSHPAATMPHYGGAKVRGYSVAGSSFVRFSSARAHNLRSHSGSVFGFDVFTDAHRVDLHRSQATELHAGTQLSCSVEAPHAARAIGLRIGVETRQVRSRRFEARSLHAPGGTESVFRGDE